MNKENQKKRDSQTAKNILEQIVLAIRDFSKTGVEQTLIFEDSIIIIKTKSKKTNQNGL